MRFFEGTSFVRCVSSLFFEKNDSEVHPGGALSCVSYGIPACRGGEAFYALRQTKRTRLLTPHRPICSVVQGVRTPPLRFVPGCLFARHDCATRLHDGRAANLVRFHLLAPVVWRGGVGWSGRRSSSNFPKSRSIS